MCFIYYCNCDSTTDARREPCVCPRLSPDVVYLFLECPCRSPPLRPSVSYVCFSGPRFVSVRVWGVRVSSLIDSMVL